VAREGGEVRLHRLRVATEGPLQTVDVRVGRLETPEALHGLILIVFTEVLTAVESPAPTRGRRRPAGTPVAAPDPEFEQARLELQATREQMQTGQEELRSMNEELQSTNEELQSTNEELTTSKEEMQSLNEELQTVNAELRAKVDELSRANNDMKNLLNSTEIATVFLDNELNVRRFTTAAARIIKLIPGDVGRPVTDLASALLYPDLVADATSVLQTLAFTEKQITTRGGDWFAVRIMPYRTVENVIDGVVITFLNITGHRQRAPGESQPSGTTELRP
jgi:two-component system CheB/CheR fusion protein